MGREARRRKERVDKVANETVITTAKGIKAEAKLSKMIAELKKEE